MSRLALALALGATVLAIGPAPAHYLALGGAIGAIGLGILTYGDRAAPGAARLVAAGAITVGCIGLVLGLLRVILAISAIDHLEGMVTS